LQTLRELITDGRLESEARILLKSFGLFIRRVINEDAEVMLDDSYKWLRWLGEHRFFLPDMERMFSLSCIWPLSLHQSMDWDLTEEQSEVSLGQIFHDKAIPVGYNKNIVGLLLGSLEAGTTQVRLPVRHLCS